MKVVIPFDAREPKTRLGPLFTDEERQEFARAMLHDVLETVTTTGHDPTVLATKPIKDDCLDVVIDDRPLNSAVNALLERIPEHVALVMADLPLMTEAALRKLLTVTSEVGIAPGRGGGTNALLVAHEEFRVDYHDVSYLDHLSVAAELNATVDVVDSYRLAVDIDEPSDLSEILIHGDGRSRDWLVERGFELDRSDGRVTAHRRSTPDQSPLDQH